MLYKTKTIEPLGVYSVQEASKIIGSSQKALIQEIKNNKIKGKFVGKGYKVLGESLIKYLRGGDKDDR